MNGEIYNHTYEESMEFIRKFLPIRKNKANSNGEVFTPSFIIEKKFDVLVKEKPGLFTDTSVKILDPCSGIGNYSIILYHRLMKGLSKKIPDKQKRHTHIVKNMLYMVEFDDRNYEIARKLFGKDANIYKGDFLDKEDGWKNSFGVSEYGIIVENPPFNEKRVKHGEKNYYVYFIDKAMKYLKKGGYLLAIHPPGWRIPENIPRTGINLNSLYLSKQIIYAQFYQYNYVKYNIFDSLINVDIVIVENVEPYKSTEVVDYHNNKKKINLKSGMVIPNFGLGVFDKIRKWCKRNKCLTLLNSSFNHAANTKEGPNPNVHTITAKMVNLRFKKKVHPHQNMPKLFVNGLGMYNRVFYDKKGEYGATQSPFYLLNPTNSDLVFFHSKLFQYICDALKIKGNNLSKPIINQFLPKFTDIVNEGDIYNILRLTNKEIEDIEKTKIKPTPDIFSKKPKTNNSYKKESNKTITKSKTKTKKKKRTFV